MFIKNLSSLAGVTASLVSVSAIVGSLATGANAASRQMESLTRGVIAADINKGMYINWRLLGTDSPNTQFNVYRDGTKIATIKAGEATGYVDANGKSTNKYAVSAINDGVETTQSAAEIVFTDKAENNGYYVPYKTLTLDRPADLTMPDASTCSYTPADMSAGDLDGDGQYELIVKWDPSNAKDNSNDGYTGNVYIDAYKLDGTKLWRIDLGKNIRAGAHYTQFMVYDLDGDGKAEVAMKTADGTTDGKGNIVGDGSKDYRSTAGRILSGPEYLTVFKGETGEVITTIDYNPSRSITSKWGDTYGNRCDRMLATIAYLDGIHPSLVMVRGYYTNAYLAAYDFDGKELKLRWFHKSETSGQGLYGQGYHNIAVGDVNGDGLDEIIFGSAALKADGSLYYSTGFGHGDAGHLSDMDPDKAGLEFFGVLESTGGTYSDNFRTADGTVVFASPVGSRDNGRGLAADIDSTKRGFEMWSARSPGVYNVDGTTISTTKPGVNFRVYWTGDAYDELLDGNVVNKWNGNGTYTVFDASKINSSSTCNGTKSTPNISADLFGDWREEIVLWNGDNPAQINIFTTPIPTTHRMYTLMHDATYRVSIAWQNVAYNQPPHLGLYLPDMVKNLKMPDIYVVGNTFESAASSSSTDDKEESSSSSSVGEGGSEAVITSSSSAKEIVTATATDDDSKIVYKVDASTPSSGDGLTESSNTGFEDKGYYNFSNTNGSSATWQITSQSSLTDTPIYLRYTNGGKTARNMDMYVNGTKVATFTFEPTTDWTTYSYEVVNIDLEAGDNEIKMVSTSADGGPNIDLFGFEVDLEATTIKINRDLDAHFARATYNARTGILFTGKAGVATLNLRDIHGSVRYSAMKNVNLGVNEMKIENVLPQGIYFVEVRIDNKIVAKQKFIQR